MDPSTTSLSASGQAPVSAESTCSATGPSQPAGGAARHASQPPPEPEPPGPPAPVEVELEALFDAAASWDADQSSIPRIWAQAAACSTTRTPTAVRWARGRSMRRAGRPARLPPREGPCHRALRGTARARTPRACGAARRSRDRTPHRGSAAPPRRRARDRPRSRARERSGCDAPPHPSPRRIRSRCNSLPERWLATGSRDRARRRSCRSLAGSR